ncbi:hypothetical protein AYI70_g3291 [Smittium culicis]|uniref:Uncharacterized protein n=1 Tax=Smittium culicis TaxID=133412 RepID=A0A1R1Y438_9FUNG|nr:hypothetical protein AYI70_g3291 [Smittium culicis]
MLIEIVETMSGNVLAENNKNGRVKADDGEEENKDIQIEEYHEREAYSDLINERLESMGYRIGIRVAER